MLGAGGFGLLAFCNKPRGVEEVVIEGVVWGSDVDRREGMRGPPGFIDSHEGLIAGDFSCSSSSSLDSFDRGLVGSRESSDVVREISGGVAMVASSSGEDLHERFTERRLLKP
jgi:hypothetical protein